MTGESRVGCIGSLAGQIGVQCARENFVLNALLDFEPVE